MTSFATPYGVHPNEIEWVSTKKDSGGNLTGGVSNWEKIRPEGTRILDAAPDEDESTLLIQAKVDAIMHPAEPKVYQYRNPLVARLFVDHKSVEQAYFKQKGVFPIMHSVAIRKEASQKNTWLAKGTHRRLQAAGFRRKNDLFPAAENSAATGEPLPQDRRHHQTLGGKRKIRIGGLALTMDWREDADETRQSNRSRRHA